MLLLVGSYSHFMKREKKNQLFLLFFFFFPRKLSTMDTHTLPAHKAWRTNWMIYVMFSSKFPGFVPVSWRTQVLSHWAFQCFTMACFVPGGKFTVPKHRFTLLEGSMTRCFTQAAKGSTLSQSVLVTRGMLELCLSQNHSGNKRKFKGMCYTKFVFCTSVWASVM